MTGFADHPLLDARGDGWALTEVPAPVIALTPGMADFLHRAAAEGLRPIVVGGPRGRVTQPLSEVLSDLGGHWLVRTTDGFYDARSGVAADSPATAIHPPSGVEISPDFLARPLATRMRLVVSMSTRHRVGRPLRLGGVAESLSTDIGGAPPEAWGPTEPVVAPWDRDELTTYSRRRMPADSLWIAVGSTASPAVATIRVARTAEGVEETTHSSHDVGGAGDPRHAALAETARTALAGAATHGMPLLGVALAHVSAPDLSRFPSAESVAEPLALVIGPAGGRLLGLDLRACVDGFDAVLLGSPRLPSILVPLGTVAGGGWQRLEEFLGSVGPDRVADAFARAPLVASRLRRSPSRQDGA